MPSTNALIKAYGHLLIPDRIDEMTYQEAKRREVLTPYDIRQDLMNLYERDCKTIKENHNESKP
jgi:hypothetical protein